MTVQKIICIFLILLLTSTNVLAESIPDDYLNEFSYNDEQCQIEDFYYYYLNDPWLFDNSRKQLSIPVTYKCCTSQNECTQVLFDIQNNIFPSEKYVREIFDVNHIRSDLRDGVIDPGLYQIGDALDSCDVFGFNDKFQDELINIVGASTEVVTPLLDSETRKFVKFGLKGVKSIGMVEKVNPVGFAVGVACYLEDNRLNSIVEDLAKCQTQIDNIRMGVVFEGVTNDLSHCNKEVEKSLSLFLDSTVSILKNGADKMASAGMAIFSYLTNLFNEPEGTEFQIKETSYELAKQAYEKIKGQSYSETYDQRDSDVEKYFQRITEKYNKVSTTQKRISEYQQFVNDKMPSKLAVAFSNIFFEPNYNLSKQRTGLKIVKQNLQTTNNLIQLGKFNSAEENLTFLNQTIYDSENIIESQKSEEKTFDVRWKIGLISLGAIIFVSLLLFFYYVVFSKKRSEEVKNSE